MGRYASARSPLPSYTRTQFTRCITPLAYMNPKQGCSGFRFPETPEPNYRDFVFFLHLRNGFAPSDVVITDQRIRKIVTFHCLAAFGFNIGVLAFTINLLASAGG